MGSMNEYRFNSGFSPYHLLIIRLDGKDYKVPHVMDDLEFESLLLNTNGSLPFGIRAFHFTDLDQIMTNPVIEKMPICDFPLWDFFNSEPTRSMRLKDKRKDEAYPILRKLGDYVLYHDHLGDRLTCVDGQNYCILADMQVCPIHLKEARDYIEKHHRHCGAPSFHKFSVSLKVEGEPEPIGVAVASTPKARHLMDGKTLEINRVCVDPRYGNACSKLYAQVIRIGRNMGYTRFVTYTLPEESGASLRAVGFQFDGMTQDAAHGWDSPSRPRNTEKYPKGEKRRWILEVKDMKW